LGLAQAAHLERFGWRLVPADSPEPIRKVAVVVLNWNGRDDTLGCLASLGRSRWSDLEVIVSDNGSVDGSLEAISAAHPTVRIVANERNLGFAAGNNTGIERALDSEADAVFVLNNDTEVPPETIETLVAARYRGTKIPNPWTQRTTTTRTKG